VSLTTEIARRIADFGPIPVADFMAEALGHPRLGYYMTRDPLGRAGDFTTAPEISQMFGELIGLWCADAWSRLGCPSPVLLVELGPGRGTLMSDALRAARALPGFIDAIDLHLVETSPVLRDHQRATLGDRVTWHARLDEVPPGPILLIANEFFDALPIRQFQRTREGWAERLVALDPEAADEPRFRLVLAPVAPPLPAEPPARPGDVIEICPIGREIAAEIGRRIAEHGGAALIVDYGHAGPAFGDTLQAVRNHAYAPPLEAPGEADLTAHVDLAALLDAGAGAGVSGWEPVEQGEFLLALGLRERVDALARRAPERAAEFVEAADRLADPGRMGRLFKAVSIASTALGAPAGFETATRRT